MNLTWLFRLLRARLPADPRARAVAAVRDPRVRMRAQFGLAVALIVGTVLSILLFLGAATPLDPLLDDLVYQPLPPSGQVTAIAIDKKSLDELGEWPWPHALYAELLDRLEPAKPRVVAFDLVFAQPTPDDLQFAAALKKVAVGQLAITGVEEEAKALNRNSFMQFGALLLPDPDLLAAGHVGHRLVVPDADGIVRRIPAAIAGPDGKLYPALGLAAAASFLGFPEPRYDLASRQVIFGSVRVPVDDYGRVLLNFTSSHRSIPTYSFVDVLRGRVPASRFDGKIVLVGGTAGIEPEAFRIPLPMETASVYNVTLQADLAEMLVQTPPRVLQPATLLDQIALTLLLALAAGLTLPHVRPLSAAALTIIYMLLLLLVAFNAFAGGFVVRIVFPAISLLACFLAIATFRYLSEERRRHFLTALFRRYVPAESVSLVVDAVDRGELPLTGTRRMVSVLYCDLRGLSGLDVSVPPQTILELANLYLELMVLEIHVENGTVHKPMGDALVAIWNAPLDQPDHACRAARAALEIKRSVQGISKGDTADYSISVGLGLATGWAILGNLNTQGKVEYTLIGDTVNVAQRISAFASDNQVLADSPTVHSLPDHFLRQELAPIRIRGRKEPVPLWAVGDREEEAAAANQQTEE